MKLRFNFSRKEWAFWILLSIIYFLGALFTLLELSSPRTFLKFHLISSTAIILNFIKHLTTRNNIRQFLTVSWILIPFLGSISVITFFWTYQKEQRNKRKGSKTEELYSLDLEIESLIEDKLKIAKVINSTKDYSQNGLIPYAEVFSILDNSQLQRKAIQKLRTRADRDSIQTLKKALSYPSYNIKYMATMALSSIERNWQETCSVLEKKIANFPYDVPLRNELLFMYMKFCIFDLVNENIKQIYYAKSLEAATLSLQLNPKQPEIYFHLGLIQYFRKNYSLSTELIQKAIQLGGSKPQYSLWLAEVYYQLKNYPMVKAHCKALSPNDFFGNFKSALLFWKENEQFNNHSKTN